jgi:phospholipid/cholesterol/gamma-HCH transport system substrate-binding protein
METKANFFIIGLFTLATLVAAFFFVLWFSGLGRTSGHRVYEIIFSGSVSGLSRGSSVLFNGLKVGEVTSIDFLEKDPSRVVATIDISDRTPMMEDTKARLELQGLTGAAAIALTGGSVNAKPLVGVNGAPPAIYADRSDFQNLLENVQRLSGKADDVLGRLDKLVVDNGPAITDTIKNVDEFSKVLSNSSSGINSFLSSAGDIGQKIGPLTSRLQVLSDDVDKLVKAVDVDKVRGVVDNVSGFAETLRDNKGHIDSVLSDAATLAKNLNGTNDRLNAALGSFNDLAKSLDGAKISGAVDNIASVAQDVGKVVKSIDTEKLRSVVSNVEGFTATLDRNQGHIDSLFADSATLAKSLNGTRDKLDSALNWVGDLSKSIDSAKINGVIDNVSSFTATLRDNKGNVDRALKDASELAAKLNNSADKLDGVMTSAQDFLGSPDTKGALAQVGDAAKSVQKLADDLNARTKDIAAGLSRFTGSGLREYEALAIDGRRAINDLDRAVRDFSRNPNQLIFGAKPALPEYRGGQ